MTSTQTPSARTRKKRDDPETALAVAAWEPRRAAVVKPFTTAAGYERAKRAFDELLAVVGTESRHPLFSILHALADNLHAYQAEHEGIPDLRTRRKLRWFKARDGLETTDLIPPFRDRQAVSAHLIGKNRLNLALLHAVAERFGVHVSVFYDGLTYLR
jgi:hypothetical protein